MLDIYQSINREALNESFSRFHHLISQKKSIFTNPTSGNDTIFLHGRFFIHRIKKRKKKLLLIACYAAQPQPLNF